MSETYEGELDVNAEYNIPDNGVYRIGNQNIDDIFYLFIKNGQKIRITIEVIPEDGLEK